MKRCICFNFKVINFQVKPFDSAHGGREACIVWRVSFLNLIVNSEAITIKYLWDFFFVPDWVTWCICIQITLVAFSTFADQVSQKQKGNRALRFYMQCVASICSAGDYLKTAEYLCLTTKPDFEGVVIMRLNDATLVYAYDICGMLSKWCMCHLRCWFCFITLSILKSELSHKQASLIFQTWNCSTIFEVGHFYARNRTRICWVNCGNPFTHTLKLRNFLDGPAPNGQPKNNTT